MQWPTILDWNSQNSPPKSCTLSLMTECALEFKCIALWDILCHAQLVGPIMIELKLEIC